MVHEDIVYLSSQFFYISKINSVNQIGKEEKKNTVSKFFPLRDLKDGRNHPLKSKFPRMFLWSVREV